MTAKQTYLEEQIKKFEDKFSSLKVIVVSQEIESWLYSAWDFSDNKMKKDFISLPLLLR